MFGLWRLKQVAQAGFHRPREAARKFFLAAPCLLAAVAVAVALPVSDPGSAMAAGSAATLSAGRDDCDRHRDFYARLQGRSGPPGSCPGRAAGADSCCVHDDGVCLGGCGPENDNDCVILASLLRAHEFLAARKSAEGLTPDDRGELFGVRSEYHRLVPCTQALGYMNLYRHTGRREYLKEATDRLDFLADNWRTAVSGWSYDGQLGWAFLQGYRLTCDTRYLEAGLHIARVSNPNELRVLNWGMLAALNMLEARETTGDDSFLTAAREILALTLPYQNSDGSFPHQDDVGKRSLPYTSWLAHEMCRYQDLDAGDPALAKAIDDCAVLLSRQTASDGSPAYEYDSLVVLRVPDPMCLLCSRMDEEGCSDYCSDLCSPRPGLPPCWCIVNPEKECPHVDTLVKASYFDEEDKAYDVRGWTSELPSTAFVLARTGRNEAKSKVLSFLFSLQNEDGSFPDKWGFVPNPNHPMWVFSSDSHSVIRTSCVFFYLSEILNSGSPWRESASEQEIAASSNPDEEPARGGRGAVTGIYGEGAPVPAETAEPAAQAVAAPVVSVRPSPSSGCVFVAFAAGPEPADVVVLDAGGRLVKRLGGGWTGDGAVVWNGRD
ncbi:MAG: hypothetical protein JW952_01515, partial [Candidatus Eisenbacteria bacterium]|nr:hypothetical protein [Candidatus Eisenbacteria bacterium]